MSDATRRVLWAKLQQIHQELESLGMADRAADLYQRFLRNAGDAHYPEETLEQAVTQFQGAIDDFRWLQERSAAYRKELPLHLLPKDVAAWVRGHAATLGEPMGAVVVPVKAPPSDAFKRMLRSELGLAARKLKLDPHDPEGKAPISEARRKDSDLMSCAMVNAYNKAIVDGAPPPELEEWKSSEAEQLFERWTAFVNPPAWEWLFSPEGEPFLLWMIHFVNKAIGDTHPFVIRYTQAPEAYDFGTTRTEERFDLPVQPSNAWGGAWRKVRISAAREVDLDSVVWHQHNRNVSGGYGLLEEDPRELWAKEQERAAAWARDTERLEALASWALNEATVKALSQVRHKFTALGRRGDDLYKQALNAAEDRAERQQQEKAAADKIAFFKKYLKDGDAPGKVIAKMETYGGGYAPAREGGVERVLGRIIAWPSSEWGSAKTDTGQFISLDAKALKVIDDPLYPPGTPAAVWNAGALPYLTRKTIQGADLYGWTPSGYDRNLKVVTAEGKTVPVNSNKYKEFVGESSAYANEQDGAMEGAVTSLVASFGGRVPYGDPTWWSGIAENADKTQQIPVELQAPPVAGKGNAGWKLRWRIAGIEKNRTPVVAWAIYERLNKRATEFPNKGRLWVPMQPADPELRMHPDPENSRLVEELPSHKWEEAIERLRAHPRLTIDQVIAELTGAE